MRKTDWPVTEKAVCPSGDADGCCYCKEKIGASHKTDCVLRRRTVVVRLTIEYVTTIQEDDGEPPENALFFWNEGRYCMDTALEDVRAFVFDEEAGDDPDDPRKTHGCICPVATLEYVREATDQDESRWGVKVEDVERA